MGTGPFSCSALNYHYLTRLDTPVRQRADPTTSHASEQSPSILLTEALLPNDRRYYLPDFTAAKRKEIDGLLKRGTRRVVLKDEIPDGTNALGALRTDKSQTPQLGTSFKKHTTYYKAIRIRKGHVGPRRTV